MRERIGGEIQPKKGRNKERRKVRKKERKRGRKGRKVGELLPLIYQCSESRSSSGRELKSVYVVRATLQEVGIFPPLVYFHPKGYLAGFFL